MAIRGSSGFPPTHTDDGTVLPGTVAGALSAAGVDLADELRCLEVAKNALPTATLSGIVAVLDEARSLAADWQAARLREAA